MTVSRIVALTAVLLTAGCGPQLEGEADVESSSFDLGGAANKITLPIQWQRQQTGYWCGPGSTRIALSAKISPPTQTSLASTLGTTVNGTDHIGLITNVMNARLGNHYVSRNINDPPTQAQRDALKQSMVASISNGYALVGNIIAGWRPPFYPGGTIYHYVAIVGYDAGGDKALIADPAGQGSGGWANVPSTYWINTSDLAVWIGGKGFSGTNLPIKPAGPVTPATGMLIGTIYTGGSTSNRVPGATVVAGGKTVQSGSDGVFRIELPAGTYTATVTKSGYGSNSVSRTVTAGADIWGSMEINPVTAATGTLRGKITAAEGAAPIAGATVKAGTLTATTDAAGDYLLSLSAGTYTVTVTKAGFNTATLSRQVTAGQTIWGSLALSATGSADTVAPQLQITGPANESQLDLAMVTVTGTASDDRGTLSSVDVILNGAAPVKAPVVDGRFTADVKLQPGVNQLKVEAKDAAGNLGSATLSLSFTAGIAGAVHLEDDETQRLSQGHVSFEAKDGALLAETDLTATGEYALALTQVPVDGFVVVRAQGFVTSSTEVSVPADRRLALDVGMVAGEDETGNQAGIQIASPLNGAVVSTPEVMVSGIAVGFEVAKVTVNDLEASFTADGRFTVSVPLNEGANRLTAVATSTTGETVRSSVAVTREAGTEMRGGCSVTSGLPMFALLGLAALLRRRAGS